MEGRVDGNGLCCMLGTHQEYSSLSLFLSLSLSLTL